MCAHTRKKSNVCTFDSPTLRRRQPTCKKTFICAGVCRDLPGSYYSRGLYNASFIRLTRLFLKFSPPPPTSSIFSSSACSYFQVTLSSSTLPPALFISLLLLTVLHLADVNHLLPHVPPLGFP